MAHEGDLEVLVTTVDKLEVKMGWWNADQYKAGPFLTLQLSGWLQKTRTCTDAKKSAMFNEKIKFELVDATSPLFAELAVVLFEKNAMSGDKELGRAALRLGEVYASSPASKELCVPLLTKNGKLAGELKIITTFKRYGAAAAAVTAGEGPCWAAVATGAVNAPIGLAGTAGVANGALAQTPIWAHVAPSQLAPSPVPASASAAAGGGQSHSQYPALYEPPPPPAIFPPNAAPPLECRYPVPAAPGPPTSPWSTPISPYHPPQF